MAKILPKRSGTLEIITSMNSAGEIQTKTILSRNFKAPAGRNLVEYIEELRDKSIEQYKEMHSHFQEINLERRYKVKSYNGRLELYELSIKLAS